MSGFVWKGPNSSSSQQVGKQLSYKDSDKSTVKTVYTYDGAVVSGHAVYYGHRTTTQNFQLSYIFCKVALCIAATLYITVTLPFPKGDHCTQVWLCCFQLCNVMSQKLKNWFFINITDRNKLLILNNNNNNKTQNCI